MPRLIDIALASFYLAGAWLACACAYNLRASNRPGCPLFAPAKYKAAPHKPAPQPCPCPAPVDEDKLFFGDDRVNKVTP